MVKHLHHLQNVFLNTNSKMYILLMVLLCISGVKLQDDTFYCSDGKKIAQSEHCNGKFDCTDHSDEDPDICDTAVDEFRCDMPGEIILANKTCDGKLDCSDGSDEFGMNCIENTCNEYQFRCSYGGCIDKSKVCDGIMHCVDGSDEQRQRCHAINSKCRLPQIDDSKTYTVSDCVKCKEGDVVNGRATINFTCTRGYRFEKRNINYFLAKCENNNWVPEIPNCIQDGSLSFRGLSGVNGKCPPINEPHGTNVYCISKMYEKVNCSDPALAGTKAFYSCQEYYRLSGENEAVCQSNGKWSKTIRCEPSCHTGAGVPLVVNGIVVSSEKNVFPWVAGLYVLESNRWEYKCGASLISDNLIITAAHCVWGISANDLKIVTGKVYRDYYKPEPRQQSIYVKTIKLLTVYQDRNGNYGSDVALLFLHLKIKLSSQIHPACLLWDHDVANKITRPGSYGVVAGWGFTEDDKPSNELRYTSIPIVTNKVCINEEPFEFRKYVTFTSFCAGYRNGTSVCNGDSGSGLVFNLHGVWYLEGIVSISPRRENAFLCEPKLYSVFTKVGMYKRWIREVLKELQLVQTTI